MGPGLRAVLVVEDEPTQLRLIALNLRARGLRVITAQNGRKALRVAKTQQVALVVLDLRLPDMPGHEVCRQIKGTSDVPVIVTTAAVDVRAEREAVSAGANAYLRKPFGIDELITAVWHFLPGDASPAAAPG
jgi:DNA-binding response OmpR family regulator